MTNQATETLNLFQLLCEQGNLAALKLLQETYTLTAADARRRDNQALRRAAINGHLDICQWLHETFALTATDARSVHNQALCWAAQRGQLDVCKWLHATFKLTAKDARSCNNYALCWAAQSGHLDICQWLHETFQFMRRELEAVVVTAMPTVKAWIEEELRTHPNADLIRLLKEVLEKLEAED